jgi:hypothetical protein
MCVAGSIASRRTISAHLSANRRSMHAYHCGYMGLRMSRTVQYIDLVSLYMGELLVGSHHGSFDLAIKQL